MATLTAHLYRIDVGLISAADIALGYWSEADVGSMSKVQIGPTQDGRQLLTSATDMKKMDIVLTSLQHEFTFKFNSIQVVYSLAELCRPSQGCHHSRTNEPIYQSFSDIKTVSIQHPMLAR